MAPRLPSSRTCTTFARFFQPAAACYRRAVYLETQLTEADFIAAAMIFQRCRRGAWFKLYVLPFLCLVPLLPLAVIAWFSHQAALETAPVAILLCAPAYDLFLGRRRRLAKVFRGRISLQSRNFVDIDDTGIHSRDIGEDHFFAWSDFAAYAEGKAAFVGFLDAQKKFYMLSKRDMTPAEIVEARACFQKHVPLRRRGPTRQSIFSRSSLRGCACAAVAILVLWFAVPHLFWYFGIDYAAKHFDVANSIPKPMPDTSLATLDGPPLAAFGCTVQVPFAQTSQPPPLLRPASAVATPGSDDDADDAPRGHYSENAFGEGLGLAALNPLYQNDPLHNLRVATGPFAANVRNSIGSDTIASPYNFARAALYAQPADGRLLSLPPYNHRVFQLLVLRKDVLPRFGSTAPIYELAFGGNRAFQFGDPAGDRFRVTLDLYDRRDRHLRAYLFAFQKSNQHLTQPQINAMVASFRCP